MPSSGGTRKDVSSSNKEKEMTFCKDLVRLLRSIVCVQVSRGPGAAQAPGASSVVRPVTHSQRGIQTEKGYSKAQRNRYHVVRLREIGSFSLSEPCREVYNCC